MRESDLRVGDLLMKLRYGAVTHALISWGKRLHQAGNATDDYVHAAIYIGNGNIAKSIGEGITVTRHAPARTRVLYHIQNVKRITLRDVRQGRKVRKVNLA